MPSTSAPSDPRGVPAVYHDGRTAAAHAVSLRIERPYLNVYGGQGFSVARWPLDEVRLVEDPKGAGPARLARGEANPARLMVEDRIFVSDLESACPHLRRSWSGWRRHWKTVALWSLAAAASVWILLSFVLPLLAGQIARAMPEAVESRLGAQVEDALTGLLAAIEKRPAERMACAGADGQAVLEKLVARLAPDRPPPTLHVVDSKIVNALALPGNRILVLRGLIDFVEGPDELAGVLAHEIAHLAERHPLEVTVEHGAVAVLVSLLVGDVAGGALIAAGLQAVTATVYSRAAEAEADALGTAMMNAARFDGSALARFLERTEKKQDADGPLPGFLSTHPATEGRAAAIRTAAEPARTAALSPDEWQALRGICHTKPE